MLWGDNPHIMPPGGPVMKRLILGCVLVVCLFIAIPAQAELPWWKLYPPIITSPVNNELYGINEGVLYCWELAVGVPPDSVDYYEVMFANAPPYTNTIYDPDPHGGTCTWNMIRVFEETCWYYSAGHQENHEPIYWKVRTVYIDGFRSNWGVGYHRVGDFADVPTPLTITAPAVAFYSCSPLVCHAWDDDPDAVGYEYGWAQAEPNILYIFDNCEYHPRTMTTDNSLCARHDCIHLPIYFLVRAVYDDGAGGTYTGNWAITYYLLFDDCEMCNYPVVNTERSTWGGIKRIYR
jgi:hypothetical protein